MTHKIATRGSLLLLAALPLFTTGCGGDSATGGGIFGGGTQSTVAQPAAAPASLTSGTTAGGLTPNAAPAGGAQSGAASGQSSPAATTPNGPLAPLSGTYAGTWTPVTPALTATAAVKDTAPPTAASGNAAPDLTVGKDAAPAAKVAAGAAPAAGGAVTLKFSYPKRPSKTSLGDVSGTWADPALGIGQISGTVDKIGLPNEANAVHVVGKITFPHGKSRALVVELAEQAVGHLGGTEPGDTISLKKTR